MSEKRPTPDQIPQPSVEEPMLLVYGDPVEGFQFIGPITPNDPDLDEFVERELHNVTWWYAPIQSLSQARQAGRGGPE